MVHKHRKHLVANRGNSINIKNVTIECLFDIFFPQKNVTTFMIDILIDNHLKI